MMKFRLLDIDDDNNAPPQSPTSAVAGPDTEDILGPHVAPYIA